MAGRPPDGVAPLAAEFKKAAFLKANADVKLFAAGKWLGPPTDGDGGN